MFSPQKKGGESVTDKESRSVHEYEGSNLKLIMPHGVKLTSVWLHLHLLVCSFSRLRFDPTTATNSAVTPQWTVSCCLPV